MGVLGRKKVHAVSHSECCGGAVVLRTHDSLLLGPWASHVSLTFWPGKHCSLWAPPDSLQMRVGLASCWPVSLSEVRSETGETVCPLAHTAKAYLEKHGVCPLTRLHSNSWIWVFWDIDGVINWWLRLELVGVYDIGHISSLLLILVTLSVKQGGWTVASGSSSQLCESTSARMTLEALWEPQFNNSLSFILFRSPCHSKTGKIFYIFCKEFSQIRVEIRRTFISLLSSKSVLAGSCVLLAFVSASSIAVVGRSTNFPLPSTISWLL